MTAAAVELGPAIIEGRNLSRHYHLAGGVFGKEAVVRAVQDVSFALHPGRTLAVVGESGCGKSTLARVVTLIEEPTAGELFIYGEPAGADSRAIRRTLQIVFQNPYGSLNPRHKVGYILEEPLKLNTDLAGVARREKALATMELVGLRSEQYSRYPHMFSGGQRQRIAIARALMLEPKVLVLDEPVSALDLSIQAQVLNLLAKLQAELGLAYMFISHDLSVVRHIADEIMVMYLGRVVESGDAETVFAKPQHPYTAALMSATPSTDPSKRKKRITLAGELPSPLDPPRGCAFHPRCAYAQADCKATVPKLAACSGRDVACFHPLGWGDRQAPASSDQRAGT